MNAPVPARIRLIAWLKALECRADAWAGKRMSAEEYAEAVVLDKKLKANFLPWLGKFAVVVGFVGLIEMSFWPHLGVVRDSGRGGRRRRPISTI